ncbi:MAG: 5-formyltetrahydrofolate cyclo-ligase [Candidatus Viridilinea halotolerans]|uniref:5-formyltetrahydrofolate cyclo-ligase n=1 Tax=Candidatus Viridilinea halotolerans TaxID=2491704 RepID=A0A426U6N3_9CHLR|nr:MAG: 5-formyltetrahydrofolate cyclo-ligase [Candidatus Viridilinea halotolerans]
MRREAHAHRDLITDRDKRSKVIQELIENLVAYREAQAIHCYLAIRSEVETRHLIAAALAGGKGVACPLVDAQGVVQHSWLTGIDPALFTRDALGLPQPNQLSPARADAWQVTFVPLLAFDRTGYRLGYGKGYYDQILDTTQGLAVGIAFAAQEVASVPREPHDRPLDLVVTEEGLIWM